MKPTDKAVLGMVSESPGRNESEPTGGLDKNYPEGRAHYGRAKATHVSQTERCETALRRGGRGSTVTRTCEQLVKPSSSQREIVGAKYIV